jgi:hypothetical protein
MTTEHDHDGGLATILRAHVEEHEPPFALSADTSIALGRRTLLRRRARRGLTGVLVAAAAVAAVPLMPWGGGRGGEDLRGLDPATAYALEHYDAQQMPRILEEHTRAALGVGLDGLGRGGFSAGDSQGNPLPAKYYDKASSMTLSYGADGDRRVRVELLHSGSEAEGDARKNCENDLAQGYVFSCEVTTTAAGDVVTTRVTALRPLEVQGAGWSVVTPEELRTGVPVKGDPSQEPIDPGGVYFSRSVESVHSKTFLSVAEEIVKAPSLTAATAAFRVPPAAMEAVVTDPGLVIPRPPVGPDGCTWSLSDSDITCAARPD